MGCQLGLLMQLEGVQNASEQGGGITLPPLPTAFCTLPSFAKKETKMVACQTQRLTS